MTEGAVQPIGSFLDKMDRPMGSVASAHWEIVCELNAKYKYLLTDATV